MINQRLLAACRDSDIGALKLSIEEGAYLETRRPFIMRPKPPSSVGGLLDAAGSTGKRRKGPKEGLTPLMYTAQNGSVAGTHLLLEVKAEVAARDEDGLRPLHFAATSGVLEVCKLLLQKDADKNAVDDDGRRAADYVPTSALEKSADRELWEALLGPATDAARGCSDSLAFSPKAVAASKGEQQAQTPEKPADDLLGDLLGGDEATRTPDPADDLARAELCLTGDALLVDAKDDGNLLLPGSEKQAG